MPGSITYCFGTFKERTGTFGFSEITDETVLMPITVIKLFTPVERIDPMYVQARYASDVRPLTAAIKQVLESRHRPGAKYEVLNLSAILEAAREDRPGPYIGAGDGVGNHADHFRNRHHEHHAGDRDRAYP